MSDLIASDAPAGVVNESLTWEEQLMSLLPDGGLLWKRQDGSRSSQIPGQEVSRSFSPSLAFGATVGDVNTLSAALRSFCKRGITLFGTSPTGDDVAQSAIVGAYQLCQSMAEALVSAYYLNRLGYVRRERQWDRLHPLTVGCVHARIEGGGNRPASTVVIGQPCPTCDRGRLALVKGAGGISVAVCNAGCQIGSERLMGGGCGVRIEPAPCCRTADERMIWSEPTVLGGRAQYLPYHELGLHVV